MLEGLDGSLRAPGDAGNRLDGQVGHEPKENHLTLLRGEPIDCGQQGRVEWLLPIRAGAVRGGSTGGHRSPRTPSGIVDDPIAGEGKDPLPDGNLVTPHAPQVPGDLEEDFAQEIFGIRHALCPQVAEDGRCKLPVESPGIPM